MAAAAPGHHAAGTAPGQWPGFWPRTVCRIPAPRAQRRRGSLYMDQRLTALAIMQDAPVIPVIVLNNVAHAVPMAQALVAGGIRVLEVTLRTPEEIGRASCRERV